MATMSISSDYSSASASRLDAFRPRPASQEKAAAVAQKTLTYEEKEEIKKFEDIIENLSEEDKDAVEEWLEETLEKLRSGETDTVALAYSAPDALKAAMEAEGIDLSSILKNINAHSPENAGVNVNVDENISTIQQVISALGDSEQADANKFMQDAMEKIQSGKFDAGEIMENAPTALINAIEEQGTDLKTMLQAMNSKFLSFAESTDYSTVLFSRLKNNLSIGGGKQE